MELPVIEKVYRRYAKRYDFYFGALFQPGRKAVINRMHCQPGKRILEEGDQLLASTQRLVNDYEGSTIARITSLVVFFSGGMLLLLLLLLARLCFAYKMKQQHLLIRLSALLHDIGKIGIPDSVLRKPGKLDETEFKVMMTHPQKGREIIDVILEDFSLGTFGHVGIMRNIAEYHHEAIDGSGYPKGLKGDEIPIEARISPVADIFDALTSRRTYKAPWSNDDAFAMLRRLADTKLDRDCVDAMLKNIDKVQEIQQRFRDEEAV